MTTCKNDLILLHQGPDDPIGQQVGEPLIREYFENKKSDIIICGHCYWERPLVTMGETQFLNVDSKVFVFSR